VHYHFPPYVNTPFPPFVTANGAQVGLKTGNNAEQGYDIDSLPKDWNPNLGHWRETLAAVLDAAHEREVPSSCSVPMEEAQVPVEGVEGLVMSGGIPSVAPAAPTASDTVIDVDVQTHTPTALNTSPASTIDSPIAAREPAQNQIEAESPGQGQASDVSPVSDARPATSEPSAGESSGQASSSKGLKTHTPDMNSLGSSGQKTSTSVSDGSTDTQVGSDSEDKERKN
jgi:hypothetical protein